MAYTKEERREYMRWWRKLNPQVVKKYAKKYNSLPQYKEMRKAAHKRWVEKNREHLNAYRRERYRKQKMMEVSCEES